MKLVELKLQAFGVFTEALIDLSESPGLQVVYGPNEAGKSTAMRAVQAALFGFPHQSKDNFLHPKPTVGATLESQHGDRISFLRRKGRKNTLLHPDTNTPLPDDCLAPFLYGMDGDTFCRSFTIDLNELTRGGEEMRKLRGLVGESLFAASLGGIGLTKLLTQLDEEASEIFCSKKRKHQIAILRREYMEVQKEKKNATLSFSKWQQLQAERNESIAQKQDLIQSLNEQRLREKRLERIRHSLGPLTQRHQLIEQLNSYQKLTVLPEDYSVQERSRLEGEIAQLNPQIESLQKELDDDGRRLEDIQIPNHILEHEIEIDRLQERLGACQKARHDRESKLQLEREHLLEAVKRIIKDLGLNRSLDELEELRVTPEQKVEIQNLGNHEKTVLDKTRDLLRKRRQLQNELTAAKKGQAEIETNRNLSQLDGICREIRSRGIFEKDVDELERSVNVLRRKAKSKLESLGQWQGNLEDFAKVSIPLPQTVNRFIDLTAMQETKKQQCNSELTTLADELAAIQEEIGTLRNTTNVVTEDDLLQARGKRDDIWLQIRRQWLDDQEASQRPAELATSFSQCMTSADAIADRLRREAERVERLAQLLARKAKIEKQHTIRLEEFEDLKVKTAATQDAWQNVWRPAGIHNPLPPIEMRAWIDRQAEIKLLLAEMHENQSVIESKRLHIEESKTQISHIAQENNLVVPSNASLTRLLETMEAEIEKERGKRDAALKLQVKLQRCEAEIKSLQIEESAAKDDLAQWTNSWQAAMRHIGVAPETTAAQANERISQLTRVFDHAQKIQEIDLRITGINNDLDDFDVEVQTIAKNTGLTVEGSTFDFAASLRRLLTKTKDDFADFNNLTAAINQKRSQLTLAIRKRTELQARLDQLCDKAGVQSADQLPEFERQSQAVTQCRNNLNDVEARLLDLGGGLTLHQLETEADGQNGDQLQMEMENVRLDIEGLEIQRDEISAKVREMENAAEQANGEPLAAAADQRAIGILSHMQQEAARFVKLRIAGAVLRQQIEKHRSENEDPLLAKASDYFSQITCGEFRGLKNEYDNDEAVIMGLRHNRELLSVEQMSTGTRDQLYLALRLAYLQSRIAEQKSMPIIVDDILVQFDDQRAQATLALLAELSQQSQIILFTHHNRIVDLAKTHVVQNACRIHQLSRRKIAV